MAVKQMANRYSGECATCSGWIPAGMGMVTKYPGSAWRLTHLPSKWHGSPISGGYVDGCPDVPRKASRRTVARRAVYVVLVNDKPLPTGAMGFSGILATLRKPIPGVKITRKYEYVPACRYCNARPADEPGYCHHTQCLTGRERIAARQIKDRHFVRYAA